MTPPNDGDYHSYYAAAHHDAWWAKAQQWAAAGWGLALLGGIVGLAEVLELGEAPNTGRCLLAVLQAVVVLGGVAYIARLHHDTIRARQITAKLRELRPELLTVAQSLPGWKESKPDEVRGAVFPLLLIVAVVVAHSIGTYALLKSGTWSAGVAIVDLLVGFGLLARARKTAAG